MKKTAEKTLEKYSTLRNEFLIQEATDAMKDYAMQAIKTDRLKLKAKGVYYISESGDTYEATDLSELPIELP